MKFNVLILILVFSVIITADEDEVEISNEHIHDYPTLRFTNGNHTINRPLFHFTPKFGWMNDPNGCWKDTTSDTYHIYYQYNPNDTVWGMPLYWGHASSKDLLHWEDHKIAIRAPDWAGAYSGSMFIDDECLFSEYFSNCEAEDKNPTKLNTIAAWTWNRKNWSEAQCLSFSTDGGVSFTTPEHYCPEVDEFDDQFRDPQVVKVAKGTYIMSIAKSHQYAIHFYTHSIQKISVKEEEKEGPHFKKALVGKFSLKGYLGYQYECPNLVHLKAPNAKEEDEIQSYWVLFISINPGSQQGGSSTQYFIGQFNIGTSSDWGEKYEPFIPSVDYTTLIDVGKDFYAMQLVYIPPDESELTNGFNSAIGITWASNWQYTALVPTDPWRSSMAIPREIKLGYYAPTGLPLLYIQSKMKFEEDSFEDELKEINITSSGQEIDIRENANGALEFYLSFKTCGDAFTNHIPGVISLYLIGGSIPEEYLIFGYNVKADAFFLDRGHTNVQWVHDNPFFTDKLSMNVYGTSNPTDTWTGLYKQHFKYDKETDTYVYDNEYDGKCNSTTFSAHVLIDRNIIEIFFNEDEEGYSFITSTNTFFFTGGNFIDKIKVTYNKITDKGFEEIKIKVRQLNLKSNSATRRISEKKTDL